MKRIALIGCIYLTAIAPSFAQQKPAAADSFYLLNPVEVRAVRAGEKAPFTKTNLTKKDIARMNQGQDLPFLLNQTPSVVVNSDAGTGIGYTGIRIRGTDATRINITLNGIPYNDAESQGTFFVNLPDFASSVNSIQVQRGVGTSSNGTGAFGATVSLSTNEVNRKAYAEINNSYGSFNSWKNTVKVGTGLIDDHFTVDARLSQITSDGFIDRAKSNLQSFYLSGAYIGNASSIRLNVFSGKEKTFQAWNGIPEAKLRNDAAALVNHYNNNIGSIYFTTADSVNLFSANSRTYNLPLYKNETDNYRQTHYQLFADHRFSSFVTVNLASFLTRGIGYYENYKYSRAFSTYGLPDLVIDGTTVKKTDLVVQKWLDNYFYGQVISLQYKKEKNEITAGGGWTVYDGKHHGDITWAKYGFDNGFQYYRVQAKKTDVNAFAKWQHQLTSAWNIFTDLQYRRVQHKMQGFEDNPSLTIDRHFNFLNPKAGISFAKNGWNAYLSYAVAGKEPNRDDFEAGAANQPKKETLQDVEGGIEKKNERWMAGATFYFMKYKDQLVLTGKVNDVGAYTRINVPRSYRAGIELQGGYTFNKFINAVANLALSRSRIREFTEFVDAYDANFESIGQLNVLHQNTSIAFSPDIVGGATLTFLPVKNMELSLLAKYVGQQYLDNTSGNGKKLDAFYTQDLRVIYHLPSKHFGEWTFTAQLNNVFNAKYEPNGYTFGYVYDGTPVIENFYFPMAGRNGVMGVSVRL